MQRRPGSTTLGWASPSAWADLGQILYEIFSGKAGALAEQADSVCEKVKTSFAAVRFIVSVGWSTIPLGYLCRYLSGSVVDSVLNLMYRLAVFINQIAFSFAVSMGGLGQIWYEILSGNAGALAEQAVSVSDKVKTSFAAVCFIFNVGWSINPLGHWFRYSTGWACRQHGRIGLHRVRNILGRSWCLG